jgi:hypothetical protein
MISDKTARDRANNQKFKDTYVHASQEQSASNDPRNGHWTVLLKGAKGSGIPSSTT